MKLELWKNLEGKYEILHFHWKTTLKRKKELNPSKIAGSCLGFRVTHCKKSLNWAFFVCEC